ncbi:MAG: T9SS type A sorting domain-containing protein, partial [Bacteroidaceae bacterium]|nr:T9SS type A sorting domain-containing protein [Bacteroidaceae bacterium]
INYAFTSGRCTHNGLLRHEGTSMDQSLFKAVLIPYAVNFCLDEEMQITYRRTLVTALQKNADALWKNLDKQAYPKMYCPYYWGEAYNAAEAASMGAMASGASLLENVSRMCKDLTTQETGIKVPYKTSEEADENVYSLDGKLLRNGTSSTLGLPAGIYVVNGKKVYTR